MSLSILSLVSSNDVTAFHSCICNYVYQLALQLSDKSAYIIITFQDEIHNSLIARPHSIVVYRRIYRKTKGQLQME